MDEQGLRELLRKAPSGDVPRRAALQRLLGLGLTLPMAWVLLADAGLAQTASVPAYKPTKRGGGGMLRLLYWQAPTLLNPHFATGNKDSEAANLFYEALLRWDGEGQPQPVLAAELPSRDNGGLAADGRSVTWKLKKGVAWHDGRPFSADDLIFNWRFVGDPATAATTAGAWAELELEKLDSHTVRVHYPRPTPFWPRTYSSQLLLPRHVFEPWMGAKSRDAPANVRPVGTGPYRLVEFRPGDLIRAEANPAYHQPNRPHFDTLELKGGGDATSAARAVLQTGEFDYAWNLVVEDELLRRLEAGAKGRLLHTAGGTLEFIDLNHADPWTERDGERSHPGSRHPLWHDEPVRRAMAALIDRDGIQRFIYGRGGVATSNLINSPARFRSPRSNPAFDVARANALLDAAGWLRGADGVRAQGGRRLELLFQTTISAPRQKVQTVVKQACAQAGIKVELKATPAAVFFGADPANPDTNGQFRADMQMYASTMGAPDPERFIDRWVSWERATRANKWQGRNVSRFASDEVDRLYRTAEQELDPVRRAALFVRMNDLVVGAGFTLPLLHRTETAAAAKNLRLSLTGWSNTTSTIADWYREG